MHAVNANTLLKPKVLITKYDKSIKGLKKNTKKANIFFKILFHVELFLNIYSRKWFPKLNFTKG